MPLRTLLITVVVALICLAAGGVGFTAYTSSVRAVDQLFRDLAYRIGEITAQRTLRYFEPALPYAQMTASLARSDRLAIDDELALLDHFHAAITANASFTWASFARADGTYIAVYRSEDEQLRGTIRSQVAPSEGVDDAEQGNAPQSAQSATQWREYRGTGDHMVLVETRMGNYDPRERDWYREAEQAQKGRWVRPFLFFTQRQPGFMYVMPLREQGQLLGVFAVEYEVSYLSQFLAGLKVREHGRVYLLHRDGFVLGHPDGAITDETGPELAIARAETHPDRILRGAWTAMGRAGGNARWLDQGGYFSFTLDDDTAGDDFLAMAHPFPDEHALDLTVLVIAPSSDFFGDIRSAGGLAAGIALVVALVAILLGLVFSSRIAKTLRIIANDMEHVGRFELSDRNMSERTSLVRELNNMAEVTDRMKKSLRSFGKYVPRSLVRELLASGNEALLGGETRKLTILFSDVAGFTSISENMQPAHLVDALGTYLHSLSACIQRERGTVDKYIGDAIMAFWGAPNPVEDHALRACHAALAMQAAVAKLEEEARARGHAPFKTRIGINTGDCIVGNIGAPDRLNYTVMGDAVNLSSRLEALNSAYGTWILLGEETAEQVRDALLVRPLDWVAVKGKSRAVQVYQLIGPRDNDELLHHAVAQYQQALELYRNRQWDQAVAAFESAREGFGGEDPPSDIMIERCRAYATTPPPADWDGSFVRDVK